MLGPVCLLGLQKLELHPDRNHRFDTFCFCSQDVGKLSVCSPRTSDICTMAERSRVVLTKWGKEP
jgi:hypothetical protein